MQASEELSSSKAGGGGRGDQERPKTTPRGPKSDPRPPKIDPGEARISKIVVFP